MKKFFQFACLALAAVAMVACGNKSENKDENNAETTEASETAEQVYKITKNYGGSTGTNYASFERTENEAEETLQVEFNGDNAVVTLPFKLKKTDQPLAKEDLTGIEADMSYKDGDKSEKITFKIADDKNYLEEFNKAQPGDELELTLKAETTKDVLDKLNGQTVRYFMMYY